MRGIWLARKFDFSILRNYHLSHLSIKSGDLNDKAVPLGLEKRYFFNNFLMKFQVNP
jgi:hypothetical protein